MAHSATEPCRLGTADTGAICAKGLVQIYVLGAEYATRVACELDHAVCVPNSVDGLASGRAFSI